MADPTTSPLLHHESCGVQRGVQARPINGVVGGRQLPEHRVIGTPAIPPTTPCFAEDCGLTSQELLDTVGVFLRRHPNLYRETLGPRQQVGHLSPCGLRLPLLLRPPLGSRPPPICLEVISEEVGHINVLALPNPGHYLRRHWRDPFP